MVGVLSGMRTAYALGVACQNGILEAVLNNLENAINGQLNSPTNLTGFAGHGDSDEGM